MRRFVQKIRYAFRAFFIVMRNGTIAYNIRVENGTTIIEKTPAMIVHCHFNSGNTIAQIVDMPIIAYQ